MVIHLGDVAFTHVNLPEFLASLPGRPKVLVRGNHDTHTVSWYLHAGFDFACDAFVQSRILFTHEPARVLPEGCEFNIHCHLHNTVPEGFRRYPHCRLFSLEYTNYEPRQVEKFLRYSSGLVAVLPATPAEVTAIWPS
jgi:calcineurin-like phosphoesterase family protein